jgi:DNA-binding transcriptional MerR regulator
MHVSGQAKAPSAYRTITEVAEDLDVPQHVLRFWEGRFPQIRPVKRGGGRRYYRPSDVVLLRRIRKLLYEDGYTIRGVLKLLSDEKAGAVAAPAESSAAPDDGEADLSDIVITVDETNPAETAAFTLPAGKRDTLWDILIELRALRGSLRR